MDISSTKSIQYAYQIDYAFAEPTHLKSQVHSLPVVSPARSTPRDSYEKQETFVPNNDERITYAAPSAATFASPLAESAISSTAIPTINSTLSSGGIGNAGLQNLSAPNDINPLLSETNVGDPQRLIRSIQSESSVSHPATPVSAEAGMNGNVGNVLHPTQQYVGIDQISSDVPSSDANPIEGVKATPKTDFIRAERGFIPNQNSFLQKTGFESVITDGTLNDEKSDSISNPSNDISIQENNRNPYLEPTQTILNVEKNSSAKQAREEEARLEDISNNEKDNMLFNRLIIQQAKNLYGIISGAINQFAQPSFSTIG